MEMMQASRGSVMALSRTLSSTASRLGREARFIFTGQVEAEAASSLSAVSAGPSTAVVRVERVHRGTPVLRAQLGQPVTVIFPEGSAPGGSGSWVFFTDPVLYGETVGVREIGHVDVPDDLDALHELVTRMSDQRSEQEFSEHLAAAEVVVTGQVAGLRRVTEEGEILWSEHDPDWGVATVRVGQVLKGDVGEREIAVRYPRSRDVRWYRVPKPRDGEEALFILHRDGYSIGDAVLVILHPGDVITEVEEQERVRRLI
jgi:hypothetical protein